ncbi:MAG: DUF6178 family protein, partial [Geopsychrobacter sp.]|nr:DUF6178 family protein [Geopsychrobacter sp.]
AAPAKRIISSELNSMPVAERLETLRNSRGKAKYEMLLDAKDGATLTPLLHPQEIYLTVAEIGPEFASELLLLTSTEQITTLIDLDCWEADHLDAKSTMEWLSLLLEAGGTKASKTIIEMEPELVDLILKKFIRGVAGPEAYDDDDADSNANRLEGLYDIDYCDEVAAKIVGGLLEMVHFADEKAWIQLLELVRSELDSVLEEEVYQSRNNRLLDYGFMSPAEAKSLYSRVDPDNLSLATDKQFEVESNGLQSPMALLRMAQPGGILAEVLSAGINHQQATELCLLANRKMAADLVDLSREESVTTALSQLYAGLNLGLEHLSQNDVERAEKLFHDSYLLQIFQVGHSLIKKLADRGTTLLTSTAGHFLDGPYCRFISSLNQNPPEFFRGIRIGDPQQAEEISTLKQLSAIESILNQIEQQQQLFNELFADKLAQEKNLDLSDCNIEEATDLTLSDLFLTALANQLLGGEFSPQPLAACELPTLYRLIVDNGRINPTMVIQIRKQLEDQLPGASDFADYALEIWQEEFCQLEESEIDPRFLSGLIIRL